MASSLGGFMYGRKACTIFPGQCICDNPNPDIGIQRFLNNQLFCLQYIPFCRIYLNMRYTELCNELQQLQTTNKHMANDDNGPPSKRSHFNPVDKAKMAEEARIKYAYYIELVKSKIYVVSLRINKANGIDVSEEEFNKAINMHNCHAMQLI
jgi:hypothetical protein